MATFDVSKNWMILVPPNAPAARKAAEDLSRCLRLLGPETSTRGENAPVLMEASVSAEPRDIPVIILNSDSGNPEARGFSWRVGEDRVEIFGQGEGGLCKGIYDFLSALGFRWPEQVSVKDPAEHLRFEKELLPPPETGKVFSFKNGHAQMPSDEGPLTGSWKRLVIPEKSQALQTPKKRAAMMTWAIRNGFDALVFPFGCPEGAVQEAKGYGLAAEAGGWVISSLVPRKLFFFHKELFRMEGGERKKKIHFCPTNPETIAILRSEGKKMLSSIGGDGIRIFHLWPEQGEENTWCTCPSCRAFTYSEQYCIAVNAVGDALAELYQDGLISMLDEPDEENEIALRPNIFRISPVGITTLRW
jgi:hypothetical protein